MHYCNLNYMERSPTVLIQPQIKGGGRNVDEEEAISKRQGDLTPSPTNCRKTTRKKGDFIQKQHLHLTVHKAQPQSHFLPTNIALATATCWNTARGQMCREGHLDLHHLWEMETHTSISCLSRQFGSAHPELPSSAILVGRTVAKP